MESLCQEGSVSILVCGWCVHAKNFLSQTWVSVTQLAAYRSPKYFRDAEKFYPERWLGDSHFDSDNRDVFHPFSIGPRNCIGMKFVFSRPPPLDPIANDVR